jgi:hypothetical protein
LGKNNDLALTLHRYIKIGMHTGEVLYPYVFKERSDCEALACVKTKRMYVGNSSDGETIPDNVIAENLFHEILHQVCYMATGHMTIFDDEKKHEVFSNYLFQVLCENRFDFGGDTIIDWYDWEDDDE